MCNPIIGVECETVGDSRPPTRLIKCTKRIGKCYCWTYNGTGPRTRAINMKYMAAPSTPVARTQYWLIRKFILSAAVIRVSDKLLEKNALRRSVFVLGRFIFTFVAFCVIFFGRGCREGFRPHYVFSRFPQNFRDIS